MTLDEFEIGQEFIVGEQHRWRCTDKGTRVITAIQLDAPDPSWYNGPPYAVYERVFDEEDMLGCEPA